MTGYDPIPTPSQRRLLQQLRTDLWRTAAVGERVLTTVTANGWIERRAAGEIPEFRLTPAGLEA